MDGLFFKLFVYYLSSCVTNRHFHFLSQRSALKAAAKLTATAPTPESVCKYTSWKNELLALINGSVLDGLHKHKGVFGFSF